MRSRGLIILLGVASLVLYLGLTEISKQFNWGEGYADRPILLYLALYFALFGLYAAGCTVVLKRSNDTSLFWIVIFFGLLFRTAVLPSQQIQEDDIYRYLWDGKVFAGGINPYEYAPLEIDDSVAFRIKEPDKFKATYSEQSQNDLQQLTRLKWETDQSLLVFERINHSHVSTIYPPMAQYVFRLVNHIRPDSILFMRLAFLLFDLAALTFIVLILQALGKNRNLSLVYFWSPLVIKETFNSTHLDIIGISFLCASIFFLVRCRNMAATFFLALSFLGKLYPVILFPLYLQRSAQQNRTTGKPPWTGPLSCLLLFFGTVILFYLPFLGSGWKTFEGLRTFAAFWQSNDSIFAILLYMYKIILPAGLENLSFLSNSLPTLLSKITALSAVVGLLFYFMVKGTAETTESAVRCIFFLLALVFLLSPVANPWYLTWVVPFLCFFPFRSLILLTGLVGMYYLDFYFDYQEMSQYVSWTPWMEYTPFYLVLGYEWWSQRKDNNGVKKKMAG